MKPDFPTSLAEALRRRLFPATGLHVKQVAGAIGCSSDTLARWWRGETRITAEAIAELDRFFVAQGCGGFLAEVYGIEAPAPDFDILRTSLQRVLARLPDPAPIASTKLWFTDAGSCLPAHAGHDQQVRLMTGLSPLVKGDLRASTCRNKGWLALELDAAGRVTIWHHAVNLQAGAARAACDWLTAHSADITSVKRVVEIDGEFAEVAHATAAVASEALELAARPSRSTATPARVVRGNLNDLSPSLGAVLRAYNEAPHKALSAAGDLGLLRTASILAVNEERTSVRSAYLGPGITLPRGEIEGRNVLDRSEREYGAMLHAHAIAALDGPTFHEITLPAYGGLNYVRPAFPIGGGMVLTIAQSLKQKVTA